METHPFESAAEFLAYLDPASPEWGPPAQESPWVFRGEGNAAWELRPRSWRPEGRDLLKPFLGAAASHPQLGALHDARAPNAEHARRLATHGLGERLAVRAFARLADDVGLPLPALKPNMPLSDWGEEDSPFWPRADHPLTALAQHHGVPTQLLDFTRNPYVAAFFAAERGVEGATHIAVVCANLESIHSARVVPVTCPRAENSYLHAQDGILLWYRDGSEHYNYDTGTWPTMDGGFFPGGLRNLTLPVACRTDLLALLWRRRISRGHLMPTYTEVATTALEQAKWRVR